VSTDGAARRSDAGRVAVQRRDVEALRWAGEQYALRSDLAARVLARWSVGPGRPGSAAPAPVLSDRSVRGWAARMERAGYLHRSRLWNGLWLAPTLVGLRLAGLPFVPWAMDARKLEHAHAVAVVRLALERAHPAAGWESERFIRRRWEGSGARVRIADGGLELPDGRRVAIEVELSTKQLPRYRAVVADQDPAWTGGVWWFAPAREVPLLRQRLDDALAPDHQVLTLPNLGEVER
jgi:hypothetical protein